MSACDCVGYDGTKASKRGALSRAVEAREVTRRAQDAARQEIDRYYSQQKAVDAVSGNQLRDDLKRREREFKERAKEADMLNSLYQTERNNELTRIRTEEEEKLATALAKRQQAQDRSEKEIQRLRIESEELRSLAEKIRVARVNKERSEQLQEKATIRSQQQDYDRAFNQFVEQSEAAAMQKESEFQARRREQAVQARMVLEEQMQEKQDALVAARDEFERERAMVDEVLRRIADEDAAEASLRRQKQDETKAFIAAFLADQDAARKQKVAQEQAENRRIQEHWERVRDREAQEAAKQAMRKEAADRMYEHVKREMEAQARAREEEEQLINLLHLEELEAKRKAEDEARKRRAEELRAEMLRANEYQMKLKAEREAAMRQEEEDFRGKMMAKFAEDDRIEQMNVQKRRMRTQEHARAVQAMVEERRRMYEEQKRREEEEVAAKRAEDERQLALIEEERRRLLREVVELRDFLPRGVYRDQADVQYVNQLAAGASGNGNGVLANGNGNASKGRR